MEGKDVLALLPTGGGKSVCYQVPGLMMDGITIVVTPLIALMQDQVHQLRTRGILATAVYSGMSRREIDITLDNCIYGKFKFLYVSPERLETEIFIERFKRMKVSLVAIDEAHCVSQWGHDFRPPYLRIAALREWHNDVPFLAVTATATREVREDIVTHLQLRTPAVFQSSYARNNLSLVVRRTEAKEQKLVDILRKVPGSAIVYVRSRNNTVAISKLLQKDGIPATFYHAGLSHLDRMRRQEDWISGRSRVMVATNAFGMGIDKPDVRVVVHLDLPENLESYFQEAGRAGRDHKHSYAALIFHPVDAEGLKTKVQQSYPSVDAIRKTYQALANYLQLAEGSGMGETFDFDTDDFSRRFSMRPASAFAALKKLEEQGLLLLSEGFYRASKVHIQSDKARLYEFQVANARFDPVIKCLLRTYGGELFNEFIPVNETSIAHQLKLDEGEVRKQLDQMSKLQVIGYEPSSEKPQLTFTTPRFDPERLPLDAGQLNTRRDLAMSKAQAMINYAVQQHQCRMQFILNYFDERDFEACGQCDVCIERRKTEPDQSFREYQTALNQLLTQRPMTVDELEQAVQPKDPNLFIEVVREMVDQGLIKYDEYWVLRKS